MPFIVLEGLDGAGKSTQLNKLIACIADRGGEYEYLHFPRFDAPFYGDLIARFLRGEFGMADEVSPWLVVYSNIAYQCAKVGDVAEREKLADWIFDLEYNHNKLPRPDISLFLDVPFHFTESRLTEVREGDDRTYLAGREDIHEASLDLQRKVRQVYLDRVSRDPGLVVIDCSNGYGEMDTPDKNFDKILNEIKGLL